MKNLLACVLSIFAISASAERNGTAIFDFSDTRLYVCTLEWPGSFYEFYPAYLDLRNSPGFYLNQSSGDRKIYPLTLMTMDFQTATYFSKDVDDLEIWELRSVSTKDGLIQAIGITKWPADDTTKKSKGYCELTPDILFN